VKKLFGIVLVLALVLSFSIVTTTPVAAHVEHIVNWDGSGDFTTIQAAINNAEDGDTIVVYPGKYEENPDMTGKALTITGIADNGVLPTIKGTLRIADSSGPTTIEYLSFIANFDGHDDPWDASHNNSMFIRSAHDITIRHCSFDGSSRFMDTPYSRAAINANTSSGITLDNCVIENGYYMAIYGLSGGIDNLTVKNSVFRNNKSGINLNVGDNLVVENTDIGVVAQAVDSDSYGVRIATNSVVYGNPVSVTGMTIIGGTFTVDRAGLEAEEGTTHGAIVIRSQAQGELKVRDAMILGDVFYLTAVGGFPADQVEDGKVDPPGLDATLNWWGDASGPYHAVDNADGTGSVVDDNVDFAPWYFLDEPDIPVTSYGELADTATGTGKTKFGASAGDIEDLIAVAVPPEPPADVEFPHGMFEFEITGLASGETVTLTIELPSAVPAGTKWWKYDGAEWHDLPISIINANTIQLELTDGVYPGDLSGEADGTIVDPGGPGNPEPEPPPVVVGWEGSPVNRLAVMAPWIALLAGIMAGAMLLVMRRRRAQI